MGTVVGSTGWKNIEKGLSSNMEKEIVIRILESLYKNIDLDAIEIPCGNLYTPIKEEYLIALSIAITALKEDG